MRVMTGSLITPPSESQMRTYLPWPTAHLDRLRGVTSWANLKPSGPLTSMQRSTETSQMVTSFRSAWNSFSNVSKRTGKYMWL